jgi:hypothetical protein
MDRTLVRDFQEPLTLLIGQIAHQHDLPLDLINQSFFDFAAEAILGMDLPMHQSDSYVFQGPSFPVGIDTQSNASARTERCDEEFVWIRTGIAAANFNRFVCLEPMSTDRDVLQIP